MSNIELDLHWIIYPPDYDQELGNYLDFKYQSSALESFRTLGKGTELWCDPVLYTHNCVGTIIPDLTSYPGCVLIATYPGDDNEG